jgi:hypothetical protein
MDSIVVRLPRWKAYLYTLIRRYRLYKWLNANWVNLGLTQKDIVTLRLMFGKYVPKGVMRKARVYRYEYLINSVLIYDLGIATREEIEVCQKLQWVKHLKVEDLVMEMKQLKEFGKEVGLKPLAMGKMDEDEIIIEIIKSINPKEEYSQEFVAWYDTLEDKYFEAAETEDMKEEPKAEKEEEVKEDDLSELVAVINETKKIDDLKEICEDPDFKSIFKLDLSKYKTAKSLKEAMLECLGKEEGEEGGIEIDDETRNELIDIIKSIENEEQLLEFISDDDVQGLLGDVEIDEDQTDVESVKAQLLKILGVEEEKKKPSLKDRLKKSGKKEEKKEEVESDYEVPFDPTDFDADEVYSAAEELPIPKLRKFVKQLELKASPKTTKEEMLEMIADKLVEFAEGDTGDSEKGEEVTITRSMVEDAIKAKDKDTLAGMCDAFEIKLNSIQRKNIKTMSEKLFEVVPEDEPKSRTEKTSKSKLSLRGKKETKTPEADAISVYQIIEKMVLDGADEATIITAVKPIYSEKGKSIFHIKKVVKQLIEIIKNDNDL